MKVLTVILGSAGPARGVRDVLTDLSAAGLVSPFLWIDADGLRRSATHLVATEVDHGVETEVALQEVLATRILDRVRVCVVVPCGTGATPVDVDFERAVAELVASNSGGARISRLRLLVQRPGEDRSATAILAPAGWHNLLIAPEDSRGPGMGHVSLSATGDPIEVGRHAAPVLAGVAGLWADLAHAPFDDVPVLPGDALRVVRSFYRRLDTAHAEAELRRQVLDFGGQLPLPSDVGSSVVYADDVASVSQTMAHAVWSRHRHLLEGPRVAAPPAPEPRTIGLRAALAMFFSFLGAVLRNAPAALFARVTNRVSSSLASTAENALFGAAPSAYKIVVNGVDAQGRRASWSEYEAASKRIAMALDGVGAQSAGAHRPPGRTTAGTADLSDLWRDYQRGALTLADAGERSPDLPAAQVGAHRAVLRSASDVVPGPSDQFVDLPGIVSATLDVHAVDPTDVLGINEIRDQLRGLEQDPALGLEARRTNAALGNWASRVGRSYAVGFGGILSQRLTAVLAEARGLLERIGASTEPADLAELTAQRHQRLVRRLQVLTGVFLVVATVAGVLARLEVFSWWVGGTGIALSVLGWCGFVGRAFMSEQQELFRLLAEREAAERAREANGTNLRAALSEVEVLSAAYRQYLSWSRALGAFLAKPLGTSTDIREVRRPIAWGLPLSTVVASGSPEPSQVKRVAEQLRHDLLGVGWLTDQWDSAVRDAGEVLGASGQDVRRTPALLAAQPGAGSGSALDEWSTMLHRGQAEAGGASLLWDRARTELSAAGGDLTRRLVDSVEFHANGHVRRSGLDDFLSGVGSSSTSADSDFFDRAVFTDLASTKGLSAVAGSTSNTVQIGLGLVTVTTQFTDGIAEEDLRLTASDGFGGHAEPRETLRVPDLPVRSSEPTTVQQPSARTAFEVPVVDSLNF